MTVCWAGFYDRDYSRNHILMEGLQAQGVEIVECNVAASGLRKYWQLARQLRRLRGQYDVLYVAFPSGYATTVAWLFGSRPLVVDAFFPLYDAYVHDRKNISSYSPRAWWLWTIDWLTARLADLVVVDTICHRSYWQQLAPRARYAVVPVGAAVDVYYPAEQPQRHDTQTINVLFAGSFIPLQGVDVIIDAAQRLQNNPRINFTFVGPRKLHAAVRQQWPAYAAAIQLLPWASQDELNTQLNQADIVLGIFGSTNKADRVIPNKVWQGVAVQKPVITKDTPALREQFTDREVYMVSGTTDSLVEAIEMLAADVAKRRTLALAGYDTFVRVATPQMLGAMLLTQLQELCGEDKSTQTTSPVARD